MTRIVKKPEERRREIIAMAQKLFLEKEYENTSLNDVVGALGVAKGTVYHYFDSKEELLDAVVESMAQEFLAIVQKKMKLANGTALESLKLLFKTINVSTVWKKTLKQLHQPGNMGLHVRLLGRITRDLAPIFSEIMIQGCKEGVFRSEHPLESCEILLAGFQFMTDLGIYPWTSEELDRRSQAFSSLIEAQFQAPKGSLSFLRI